MSCQIAVLANFQDVKSIRKYLYPNASENSKQEGKVSLSSLNVISFIFPHFDHQLFRH